MSGMSGSLSSTGGESKCGDGSYRDIVFSHTRMGCGMGESLGRALNLSGDIRGRTGGALCWGWMTNTGCRSM